MTKNIFRFSALLLMAAEMFIPRAAYANRVQPKLASSTSTIEKASFTNPVIYSDVPDVDVIRVGDWFYMASTTMHLMPGLPIMRSRNLVDWEVATYVFNTLTDSPEYSLQGGNVYGQGQWAPSLRYHDGRFYVLFATNRPQKTYIYSAEKVDGPWTKVMDVNRLHHDTSLFFDEDGKAYLAGGSGHVRIQQLKADLSDVDPDGLDVEVINGGRDGLPGLLEGTHLCKYNGKYYIFMIWWPAGGIRTEVAFRADRLAGPYEHKVIMNHPMDRPGAGVAQGCIVDTPQGDWYGMLFQDRGAVGRVPVLVPCTWTDGWPMLGDSEGKAPKTMAYPLKKRTTTPLVHSDEFKEKKLPFCWEWNHNPDDASWSLSERKGFLRLRTTGLVKDIFQARNTLSQRTEGPACQGTVGMDVRHMSNGDCAGFSVFCAEPGIIQVVKDGGKYALEMKDRNKVVAHQSFELGQLQNGMMHLRIDCNFRKGVDIATFQYSLDGKTWSNFGEPFHMIYNLVHFMGNRFAIFNYSTSQNGGYIDVDYFRYKRFEDE